ncbi:NAD(P)H-dependent flavin oxidoreductase [Salinarimonas rosea]|uniref:NAD(P)H-dependent flavin oxidoreductase n=1 Tax=Salinarimonas rosea TaxID=552063 RepID=UPI00040C6F53|nr:nitronate monooxygenase [Salinarimonas rosea]
MQTATTAPAGVAEGARIRTRITERFGASTPILNAGMVLIAGPELAAAVSNAGGIGTIGATMVPPEGLRGMIRATRALTPRPFGVDLIGQFVEPAHVDVLLEERPALVIFFWSAPPASTIERLKAAGVCVWMQVGTVAEARDAVALGVEALVLQGSEAGGHNRAEMTLATLLPAIRQACSTLPLVAAGGIVDGCTMAAALVAGAEAVWCGTRFLATHEANAAEGFKSRVVESGPGDTEISTVFGPEWPGEPVRALANAAVRAARGRAAEALEEAQGEVIGTVVLGGERLPVPRYSAILPIRDMEADLDWACLTVGEASAVIETIEPAAALVARMTRDALALLPASSHSATSRAA